MENAQQVQEQQGPSMPPVYWYKWRGAQVRGWTWAEAVNVDMRNGWPNVIQVPIRDVSGEVDVVDFIRLEDPYDNVAGTECSEYENALKPGCKYEKMHLTVLANGVISMVQGPPPGAQEPPPDAP